MFLRSQAFEATSFERVLLGVIDPSLALAFVPRHPGLTGEDYGPIKVGKLGQLRVELRIIPVRMDDRGLQVVANHGSRHAAAGPKRILNAAQERFRVLSPHDFGVALARVAQHRPGINAIGVWQPSSSTTQAPWPKSTCISSPGADSIRRNGISVLASIRRANRLTD